MLLSSGERKSGVNARGYDAIVAIAPVSKMAIRVGWLASVRHVAIPSKSQKKPKLPNTSWNHFGSAIGIATRKTDHFFHLHLCTSDYIICSEYLFFHFSMQSKIYPNIIFVPNENLAFIGSQLTQAQSLEILSPADPNIKRYTKVVKKLFSEIPILQQMIWICRVPSTSIVRIFFSEPYHYPVAHCCKQPLYVEIQHDLSGNFTCSSCRRPAARFVFAEEQTGNDQELFLQKQRQSKSRKENLRELFTSQRFRGKKLKNNFMMEEPKSCEYGSFIMEITSTIPQKSENRQEQQLSKNLTELKDIINDIFS